MSQCYGGPGFHTTQAMHVRNERPVSRTSRFPYVSPYLVPSRISSMLPVEKRKTTFEKAELGLTEEMARNEAKRCLRCDLHG